MSITWVPGPAQGGRDPFVGEQYLAAVWARYQPIPPGPPHECWEFAVVTVEEDCLEVEGSPWGWHWSDVVWWCPIKQLARLKMPEVAASALDHWTQLPGRNE